MPEATVTVTLSYATLDTPEAMAGALAEALPRGWHGTISALQDETDTRWALVLNTPTTASAVTARIGDILLWDGSTYQALDAATFAERYQTS